MKHFNKFSLFLFSLTILCISIMLTNTPTNALNKQPVILSPVANILKVHLYSVPSDDGIALMVYVKILNAMCDVVTIEATVESSSPTPITGVPQGGNMYIGSKNDFFKNCQGSICEGQMNVECELNSGEILSSTIVQYRRVEVPDDAETDIFSIDNMAQLRSFPTSLNKVRYVIVMPTNQEAGPPPLGVTFIRQSYSFGVSGSSPFSDGNMILSLYYASTDLNGADPLTLRIFEWNVTQQKWDTKGAYTTFNQQLNKLTKKFTIYVLGLSPDWYDNFDDANDIGLDKNKIVNIKRVATNGITRLELTPTLTNTLPNYLRTGSAISIPYTPTVPIQNWGRITYTTNITTGTALTISVLSADGQTILKSNVNPNQVLTDINVNTYPGLRLKVDMASTNTHSPQLFGWGFDLEPKIAIYLPFVLKKD